MAKKTRKEQLVKSMTLECKSGGHRKYYKISLHKVEYESIWIIRKNWGRIGAPKGTSSEFEYKAQSSAEFEYNEVIKSKKAKGYNESNELIVKTADLEILPKRTVIEDTLSPRFKNIQFSET